MTGCYVLHEVILMCSQCVTLVATEDDLSGLFALIVVSFLRVLPVTLITVVSCVQTGSSHFHRLNRICGTL